MSRSRKQSAWRIVAASVALFVILTALVPHTQHLTVVAACPVLALVFLFGIVHVPESSWFPLQTGEYHLPQSPDLPSRFQRPPPETT
jgi:hypothetical protein